MDDFDLPEVNQLYEKLDANGKVIGMERVLYILPGGEEVVVIRLPAGEEANEQAGRDLPMRRNRSNLSADILKGILRLAVEDPFEDTTVPAKDGAEARHRERLEKNWLLIKPIVENPASLFSKTRGPLITEAAKRSGRQKSEIYKYCVRYWQRGQVPGAIKPLYCRNDGEVQQVDEPGKKRGRKKIGTKEDGEPEGIAVSRDDRAKITKGLKAFHVQRKMSMKLTRKNTLRLYWRNKSYDSNDIDAKLLLPSEKQPTLDQFIYVWNKFRNSHASWIKRKKGGEKNFNLNERLLTGSPDRTVYAPGEVFEIDAHRGDVELVHAITRLPIGSPTVYFVIDVFSRLIVGLEVTLEAPSYIGAAMALINAFTSKVEFCRKYNVIIQSSDWPSEHLCKDLRADRGELLGKRSDVIENSLGFKIVNTPSYRADLKGVIERYFKRLNEKTKHFLPGAIRGPKERGSRDPKLDAALDLAQYTEIVIRTVCQLNSEVMNSYEPDRAMIADEVVLTPLNIWNWGIKNRSGLLRTKSPAFIQSNLLPRESAIITRAGLEYDGFSYSRPEELSEDWQFAAIDAGKDVQIAYDPRCVDFVYFCKQNGIVKGVSPFLLNEKYKSYSGLSWHEVKSARKARRKQQSKAQPVELEKQVRDDLRFDQILRDASLQRKNALGGKVTKAQLTDKVSENRQDALRMERKHKQPTETIGENTESSSQKPSDVEKVTPTKIVPFAAETGASTKADRMRRLFDES